MRVFIRLFISLLIPVIAGPDVFCQSKESGDRVALVMAINDYPENSAFPDLKNCINDAKLISKTLKSVGFKVIEVQDCNLSTMDEKLDEFRKAIPEGGTALVYFAGHGIEYDNVNYLMAGNAKLRARSELSDEAKRAEVFAATMVQAGAKSSFLLLDCCRELPANAEWAGRGQKKFGLADVKVQGDIVISMAASPGKQALEPNTEGGNSPYATALAKWIPSGLKHSDVFEKVRAEVYSVTEKRQRTWENGSFIEPFYFKRAPETDYVPWPREAVDAFGKIRVMDDDDRIKTIEDYSRLKLMNLSGRPFLKVAIGNGTRKLTSTEWLMDTLFRPEIAQNIPLLYLDKKAAEKNFGISAQSPEELFSVAELAPIRGKLARFHEENSGIDLKNSSYDKRSSFAFTGNLSACEYFLNQFTFANSKRVWLYQTNEEFKNLAKRENFAIEVMRRLPEMKLEDMVKLKAEDDLLTAFRLYFFFSKSGRGFRFIPLSDGKEYGWLSVGDLLEIGAGNKSYREQIVEDLKLVQDLVTHSHSPGQEFLQDIENIRKLQDQRIPIQDK